MVSVVRSDQALREQIGADTFGDGIEFVSSHLGPDIKIVFAQVRRGEPFDRKTFAIDERWERIDVAFSEAVVGYGLPEASSRVLGIMPEQVDDILYLAGGNMNSLQPDGDFHGCLIVGPG